MLSLVDSLDVNNSRYLLRRFYDSFVVSSLRAFHHRVPSSLCLAIRLTQHKDERARRIKLKQSVTDPIPSLTKFHPPWRQDKRRVKAPPRLRFDKLEIMTRTG